MNVAALTGHLLLSAVASAEGPHAGDDVNLEADASRVVDWVTKQFSQSLSMSAGWPRHMSNEEFKSKTAVWDMSHKRTTSSTSVFLAAQDSTFPKLNRNSHKTGFLAFNSSLGTSRPSIPPN